MNVSDRKSWIAALLLFILLVAAYSNHFDNGFYFDDTHTIINNDYIRDISLLPKFFTDIKYYGTMQGNQGYNPVLVSLNAIDYWLAGGLNPKFFHASIFFWYVVQLVLMYIFFRKIFKIAFPDISIDVKLWTVLLVAFYGLHASNAETINYIIMRSDSFSTLCIIASFLLYLWPTGRKYYLYLITMLIGIGTKETGVMFGPLLLVYIFLFEEKLAVTELFDLKKWPLVGRAILKSLPANILAFATFWLIREHFIPQDHQMFGRSNHAPISALHYFSTQWVVITHYIGNFILPLDLSADPDFKLIDSIMDRKVLLSLALLIGLMAVAVFTSRNRKLTPVSFGIFWFFIALAPTSSLHPLGQLANDHRTYFPYIGLVLSAGWYIMITVNKFKDYLNKERIMKYALMSCGILILCLHAYGTYQRNEVWNSAESLWRDVAIKSPKNARGLMNYGTTQMSKGNYQEAQKYFEEALKIEPNYSYLHINIGILKNALGNPLEAEDHFKKAIRLSNTNAEAYFFYADWLNKQNRNDDARLIIKQALAMSPGHKKIIALNERINNAGSSADENINKLMELTKTKPTAENYLSLSLQQYKAGNYPGCIESCKKALEIDPNYAMAYNNICSAYILLNEPEKAIEACKKALEIDPEYQLAKNNLRWAKSLINPERK